MLLPGAARPEPGFLLLQRAWRDVNSIAKHIGVNWDAVGAMAGQHALGLEPKGQY